jgi:hypothetical protein
MRGKEFRAAVKAATSAREREKFLRGRRRSGATPMRPGMVRVMLRDRDHPDHPAR